MYGRATVSVGPEYGHAEARKSPTVDGKVERNSDGKEIRFPVILTFREKEIARRIVLGFKQWICGFDILRVQDGDGLVVSYVCGTCNIIIEEIAFARVSSWSLSVTHLFVKNRRERLFLCQELEEIL